MGAYKRKEAVLALFSLPSEVFRVAPWWLFWHPPHGIWPKLSSPPPLSATQKNGEGDGEKRRRKRRGGETETCRQKHRKRDEE